MKALQFNYFAAGNDLPLVVDIVLKWDPRVAVFPARGDGEIIQGSTVCDKSVLIPKACDAMLFLSPGNSKNDVHTTTVSTGVSCIQVQHNPVIEYSPSMSISDDAVKIGRFYAIFDDAEFMATAKSLFGDLKRHAKRLGDSDVWIYPVAASTKLKLRPWGGPDWSNPLLLNRD